MSLFSVSLQSKFDKDFVWKKNSNLNWAWSVEEPLLVLKIIGDTPEEILMFEEETLERLYPLQRDEMPQGQFLKKIILIR